MTSDKRVTRPGVRRASAAGVAALVAAGGLLAAPAAHAADVTYQPGVGNSLGAEFNSANDTSYDWSGSQDFIGSFIGGDGTTAYCIDGVADYPWTDAGTEYGTPYKVENFTNEAGQQIGPDKTDQIAWLLNEHGGTTDADTATALQLLVWSTVDGSLPGGSGYTDWVLDDAGVNRAYNALQREMESDAYRSTDIEAAMTDNGDGTGTVSFDATIDFINGGEQEAPKGEFSGEAVLQNAEFADGGTTKTVENGMKYPITFAGNTAATTEARVEASFDGLVADYYMMIADPITKTNPATGEPFQRVILADMVPKTVQTSSPAVEVPLPNPADVVVQTQTSDFVVDEADLPLSLTDTVTVSVRQTDQNQNAEWPVGPDGELVPVDVELSLYKAPTNEPFEQSAEIPEGAELIGTDSIEGVASVGDYETVAGVEITEPGRYVFVERIPEVVLDYGQGEMTKVPEYQGDYGIAEESTYVPHRPVISTEVLTKNPTVGDTVADALSVTKFAPEAGAINVEVHAVGPFVAGSELPELTLENLADYTVETQMVTIEADGEYVTPDFVDATKIEVDEETGETADTYWFVLTSQGNAPDDVEGANPASWIPAFEDLRYHDSETYTVVPESEPEEPTTPEPAEPTVPAKPTEPSEGGLAQTGADGWWIGIAALSALLVAAGGVLMLVQRRRAVEVE